jgi:hypothetical protein
MPVSDISRSAVAVFSAVDDDDDDDDAAPPPPAFTSDAGNGIGTVIGTGFGTGIETGIGTGIGTGGGIGKAAIVCRPFPTFAIAAVRNRLAKTCLDISAFCSAACLALNSGSVGADRRSNAGSGRPVLPFGGGRCKSTIGYSSNGRKDATTADYL